MIQTLAWAVPPGSSALNRPTRLVAALADLGVMDHNALRLYHGRTAEEPGHRRSFALLPGLSLATSEDIAALSPVYLAGPLHNVRWVDVYDDWSLAPDINALYRNISRLGYGLMKHRRWNGLRTANTAYMAAKIGGAHVVPNGVEQHWSLENRGQDETKTLLMLGHFFTGRTDMSLLAAALDSPVVDRVVVGGPGADATVLGLLESRQDRDLKRYRVVPWMTAQDIAKAAGPNTVALIPNVVDDYTMSQDLMKAYNFAALGLPMVCPASLLPSAIPRDLAVPLRPGDHLDAALKSALQREHGSGSERSAFVQENSWMQRAQDIARRLN
jgi:hypothetical protein